jgi:hypothetical protein
LALRGSVEEERDRDPSAALADIRALCVAFRRAIAALAGNDIAELEASTAIQDLLVQQLQNWFRGQPVGQQPSIRIAASDFTELTHLTKVYASLLQRALRTSRLRAALCQTYRQTLPAASTPAGTGSWSCEA